MNDNRTVIRNNAKKNLMQLKMLAKQLAKLRKKEMVLLNDYIEDKYVVMNIDSVLKESEDAINAINKLHIACMHKKISYEDYRNKVADIVKDSETGMHNLITKNKKYKYTDNKYTKGIKGHIAATSIEHVISAQSKALDKIEYEVKEASGKLKKTEADPKAEIINTYTFQQIQKVGRVTATFLGELVKQIPVIVTGALATDIAITSVRTGKLQSSFF